MMRRIMGPNLLVFTLFSQPRHYTSVGRRASSPSQRLTGRRHFFATKNARLPWVVAFQAELMYM